MKQQNTVISTALISVYISYSEWEDIKTSTQFKDVVR